MKEQTAQAGAVSLFNRYHEDDLSSAAHRLQLQKFK